MPAPLPIRDDFGPHQLRALARRGRNGRVCARLPALAHALDGRRRTEATQLVEMERQTLSDWVRRYNEQGVEGLRDRPCAKRAPWRQGGAAMGEGAQAALKALVLKGPDPECDALSAWRIRELCELAEGRFGRRYSDAAPGQKPEPLAAEATTRASRRPTGRAGILQQSLPGVMATAAAAHPEAERVELRVADEARVGQKGCVTRL